LRNEAELTYAFTIGLAKHLAESQADSSHHDSSCYRGLEHDLFRGVNAGNG